MKKVLPILIMAGALLLPASLELGGTRADAQSKAETSLYKKTLAKGNMKALDKFLSKYPQSVYAPKVQQMKDSLLYLAFTEANVSGISKADALQKAPGADAIGWKKDGKEHILTLALAESAQELTLRYLSPEGVPQESRSLPLYSMEPKLPKPFALTDSLSVVAPLDRMRQYLHFAYRNGASEYVEVLYLPEEDITFQAIFYGTPLPDGRIEGQSPELIEGLSLSPETAWLAARLRENPALQPISKADLLTDESIRWWLSKNPKAQTASKLNFGKLDPESSLAKACRQARRGKGKSSSVALLDIRGYTVLCSLSHKSGECSLIWCEPVCKNKGTDPYIRSFYFENDGYTLDVVYYKGKTTFKNKISLANQGIWHLK